MAAKRKKTRHGATQPESERDNEQALFRLPRSVIRLIEAMADAPCFGRQPDGSWGPIAKQTKSEVVADAVREAYERFRKER